LAIVLQILAPGKHCDVVWQLPINMLGSAVPQVPEVPQVPPRCTWSTTCSDALWNLFGNNVLHLLPFYIN